MEIDLCNAIKHIHGDITPNKIRAVLYDLYPHSKKSRNLLIMAVECGIIKKIHSMQEVSMQDFTAYKNMIIDDYGVQEKFAEWAILEWLNVYNMLPQEYCQAMQQAYYYADACYMSRQGVYEQLLNDKFTEKEAIYAINTLSFDWKRNVLNRAEDIDYEDNPSIKHLCEQLKKEGFTTEEVEYALKNVPIDWRQNALAQADYYAVEHSRSRNNIYWTLLNEGFEIQDAKYAVENIQVDWMHNAIQTAKYCIFECYMSKVDTYDHLVSDDKYWFTEAEAKYALEKLHVDWKIIAFKQAKHCANPLSRKSLDEIYDELVYCYYFTPDEATYAVNKLPPYE